MSAYQIPFIDGNLQHYPGHSPKLEWRENCTFSATLIFKGFQRGRSAAYAVFHLEETGQQYPMFLKDLGAVMLSEVRGGKVSGWWTFCKRGANYGIKLDPRGCAS